MIMLKYTLVLIHAVFVLGQGKSNTVISASIHEEPAHTTLITTTPKVDTTNATTTPSPSTTTPTTPVTSPTTPPPTTAPTTLPPSPTPVPAPKPWVVSDNNTVCIIAEMDIKMDLKLNHSKEVRISVPKEAVANGTCGKNVQFLNIFWNKNWLSYVFKANETLKKYYLGSVEGSIKVDNYTIHIKQADIIMFETSLNHSYMCSYSDPLKITQNNDTTIQMSFSNIKLEAFNKDKSTSFSNVSTCPPDSPDIVPIVVGCALTVLVVVVLIAYLVGRKRTQARGYLSM